jgi:catechol 2,3-dioxygenase-like lactoylglutathione lyase family enzyme
LRPRFLAVLAAALVVGAAAPARSGEAPTPLTLDEIGHYFVRDRAAAERFWKDGFGAREMAHPAGKRPLSFITFLSLQVGEPSIMISPKGPFEGMSGTRTPGFYERPEAASGKDAPPVFGVHWVGVRTRSLDEAVKRLEGAGIAIAARDVRLPGDSGARAAMVVDPDGNRVVVVERKGGPETGFGFDHVQLLVASAAENERFFRDVFAGETVVRAPGSAVVRAGGARIVLSEPAALGLRPEDVRKRDPGVFWWGIDHISFLYDDVRAAGKAAVAKGHRFPREPAVLEYFGEPTVYTFGYAFSPDGLQCEMVREEGRTNPRTRVAAP